MKLNIGENIRAYRRRLSWTQEQLAEYLGVSPQSVIERIRAVIPRRTMY